MSRLPDEQKGRQGSGNREGGQQSPSSYTASLQQATYAKDKLRFDTDSYKIDIDNCTLQCRAGNKQDFVGLLTRSNIIVKDIGGNQNGN
jgi:hypothetical protein